MNKRPMPTFGGLFPGLTAGLVCGVWLAAGWEKAVVQGLLCVAMVPAYWIAYAAIARLRKFNEERP